MTIGVRETVIRPNSPHPGFGGPLQRGVQQHLDILACPRCGGGLESFLEFLECKWCGTEFESEGGIPRFFFPHDLLYGPRDVTQTVRNFYDDNPFPQYDDLDSREGLEKKLLASPLANLLDAQLSQSALILDAGCGTGQLANFLALRGRRQVIGGDLSLSSLHLAKRFKDRCAVQGAAFVQMNLFRPPFRAESFDVVIVNRVLHHTSDPLRGFQALAKLLKPDGLMVVGLFNHLGRFASNLKRLIFTVSRDRLAFLNWRNEEKRARFVNRYKQPWESNHCYQEVLAEWFGANDFEFMYSSPRIGGNTLSAGDTLHLPRWSGTRAMRVRAELGMMLRGVANEGLFVTIARKRPVPRLIGPVPQIVEAALTATAGTA